MPDVAAIEHLARLARLHLTPEEVTRLAAEATRILAAFDALPPAPAALASRAPEAEGRPDGAAAFDGGLADAILSQVARRDGRVILVPRGGD